MVLGSEASRLVEEASRAPHSSSTHTFSAKNRDQQLLSLQHWPPQPQPSQPPQRNPQQEVCVPNPPKVAVVEYGRPNGRVHLDYNEIPHIPDHREEAARAGLYLHARRQAPTHIWAFFPVSLPNTVNSVCGTIS
ncbi:unnamed protein product [Nezara viridula]|uniref:Uncharacterized protein n=1 Tax=Nezara viridula TaxID=85310 RepID=A0A9P0MWI7_NEZVI|nr:unnamed protein product [Nezara viridula]